MSLKKPLATRWPVYVCLYAIGLICTLFSAQAAQALSVDLQANPASVAKGSATTLKWTSTGAKWCYGSGYLGGSRPLNGTHDSGALWKDRWYKITCSDGSREVSDDLTVTVGGTQSGLTVDLTANPQQVAAGGSSTLSWSSTGAKWCYGSGYLGGSRPLNGTHDSGSLWKDRWYKITCSDGSKEVADQLTIAVGGSGGTEVSVKLDADPRQVADGGASTLNWSSQGASSCTASGGWSGSRALSGSAKTGSLAKSTSYTLTCQNGNQSALSSVTVEVNSVPIVRWQAPTENVDGSALVDLAAYRFYWGKSSRSYTGSARINSPTTQYQPSNLTSGNYFVAVTAIDQDGHESAYSNEIQVTIP